MVSFHLTDVWRGLAFWDLARRKRSWGEMTRRGFQTSVSEEEVMVEDEIKAAGAPRPATF